MNSPRLSAAFGDEQQSSPAPQQNSEKSFRCQECGACCSYSREWPRFSTEDEADLARIPAAYVADDQGRMKCHGDRCVALRGEIGVWTACGIYADRPEVCRACLPGDDACLMARERYGF